ncbi:hypothetical protein [Streptosporangium sp. NPDC004631]
MADRHNLCTNPALGVDVTGWGGGSTPARTAVTGFARPWAARYTAGTFMSTAPTNVSAVTPGLDYTLAIYVRVATFNVGAGAIYIEWINAGGSGFGYPSANFTASIGAVTRVSITGTAPANAVAARVIIDGINYNINTTDFTALLIEQTGTLGTYFDGDSTNGSWDGTPGLSASTLTTAPPITGTAALTLPTLTSAAAATLTASATAAAALPPLTSALAATTTTSGQISAALLSLAAAAAATTAVVAAASAVLPALTGAAAGTLTVSGAATASLPALTAALTGAVSPTGVIACQLPRLTAHLTGTSDAAAADDIAIRLGPTRRRWSARTGRR